MKKYVLLILGFVVPFIISAQQISLRDVVELKNGSIIKGIIIEQVPNQTIKIKTADGSLFVYNMAEVIKITKEETPNSYFSTQNIKDAKIKKENEQKSSSSDQASSIKGKGHIGISLGAVKPIEDVSHLPTGVTLSLIDCSYFFPNSNIGIAGKLFGNRHSENNVKITFNALMVGITTSHTINKETDFTTRLLGGVGQFSISADNSKYKITGDTEFGFNASIGLKFKLSQNLGIITNLDVIKINDYSSINLTAGIAYLF